MFARACTLIFVFRTVLCQINGEFWWMHEKVAQLQHNEPSPPKIEDISELETDESVKVVFNDDDQKSSDVQTKRDEIIRINSIPLVVFRDHPETVTPVYLRKRGPQSIENNENIIQNNRSVTENVIFNASSSKTVDKTNSDEFKFIFPENDEILWKNNKGNNTKMINFKTKNLKSAKIIPDGKISFQEEKKQTETESICTFITTYNCIRKNGIVHMSGLCPKNSLSDTRKICCILPLTTDVSENRSAANDFKIRRNKRSNPSQQLIPALQQRYNLMQRKYNSQIHEIKLATTTARVKTLQKIVTPGDYGDPYWNIKNSKFRTPSFQTTVNKDQNTKFDDYADDYDVELPKPGLIGIYSDRGETQNKWTLEPNKGFSYGIIDEDSEEYDEGVSFGYSTIDPRLDRKSTPPPRPRRRKPQRVTTASTDEDEVKISKNPTIHFHSTPDFHVLDGFKLLNIVGANNKYIRKRTTTNMYSDETSVEYTSPGSANLDMDYEDEVNSNQQVFRNCGRARIKSKVDVGLGKSSAETSCDPWVATVVLTKSPQNILCYAAIIHPRAAVTTASCIHGKNNGELSTIVGVWDLKERSKTQQRMVSVYLHPQFHRNDLANDLGLVHWKRPLRLQPNVQPACLDDPHVGDDCYFFGWGGFEQVLQERPQTQRATIQTLRSCNEKVSAPDVELPAGAFCAVVDTRGTVTGAGGPLLCKSGQRVSAVGLAVYREHVVVLLPVYEWVTSALRDLNID